MRDNIHPFSRNRALKEYAMSFEVGAAVAVVLIVFAALLAVLKFMKSKGLSFTVRVFSALGMGIVLGVAHAIGLGPRVRCREVRA